MATVSSVEQALAGREWEWEGDRSLREAQSSVVSISPMRSAMASECFRISCVKRISQMRFTVFSERPSTSPTMRQPDT